MKRSSSKLISKAGSVRNINKLAYKFNFELHIESVDKQMGASDVVVTWERGAKLLFTRPARIDKASRVAHFGGEVLTQEVTLFKKKKEGSAFEEKVFKLTARQGSERGKIIGKIEVNFADYVDIPSFTKRIGASLSSGSRIIMRVNSTYLGEAKPRRSSRGTASVDSRDPESDGLSSAAPDDDDRRSELDADLGPDLDDLDIDDDPPPRPLAPPLPLIKKAPSLRGRNRPPNPSLPSDESTSSGSVVNKFMRKASAPSPKRQNSGLGSKRENSGLGSKRENSGLSSKRENSGLGSSIEPGPQHAGAPSKVEFDKLRSENRQLRRRVEDLAQRNAELEHKISDSNEFDNSDSLDQLMTENTSLRRDVGDLEARLAREPVYADVVRDLREAKMALAILTLEKDELTHEVRKLRRR